MLVGIPKETRAHEPRVAIVPDSLAKLARLDIEALVESDAGLESGFTNAQYEAKGARIVDRKAVFDCDWVLAVHTPPLEELGAGKGLICTVDPLGNPQGVADLAGKQLTCFALELVPRISRAQSMDVLSSMANVAGYKAVLLAAAKVPKMFPMMMTAAGTIRPAKVFVLGAGVAGLQAIATARRLGAVVEAYDVRSATKEEVESLGAKFIEFDLGTGDQQDEGGYAKELTTEQKALQADLMAEQIQGADVVITTANVPGRRAPLLIPAKVVEGMKPSSVIVDMAAESGGNCECSEPGEEIVVNGVTILGPINLPGSLAGSSSQLFSNNIVNLLGLLVKEGSVEVDLEDEVIAGALACRGGEVTSERVAAALEKTQKEVNK